MTTDGWIKLGDLMLREPGILAGLCGIALLALGLAAWMDRRWRE